MCDTYGCYWWLSGKKVYDNGRCRKLTPLEYERLQTLPDNYTEGGDGEERGGGGRRGEDGEVDNRDDKERCRRESDEGSKDGRGENDGDDRQKREDDVKVSLS